MLCHLDFAYANVNRGHKRRRSNQDLRRSIGVTGARIDNVYGCDLAATDGRRGRGSRAAAILNQNQRGIGVTAPGIQDVGANYEAINHDWRGHGVMRLAQSRSQSSLNYSSRVIPIPVLSASDREINCVADQ